MDVEGCSGPTAINSSPARSSLPSWWNLTTAAACHTIQEGPQTNASSMCLLYCFCLRSRGCASKEPWGAVQAIKCCSVSFHSQWLWSIENGFDSRGRNGKRWGAELVSMKMWMFLGWKLMIITTLICQFVANGDHLLFPGKFGVMVVSQYELLWGPLAFSLWWWWRWMCGWSKGSHTVGQIHLAPGWHNNQHFFCCK